MIVLPAVSSTFQIDKANDKITNMMTLAKMLPITDRATQADELTWACFTSEDRRLACRLSRSVRFASDSRAIRQSRFALKAVFPVLLWKP
jgi:hypothetical protein